MTSIAFPTMTASPTNGDPPMQELPAGEVPHLTQPFSPIRAAVFSGLETLPYHALGGAGFERLCFDLLLSDGYQPRFFGRSGQAQLGVDLVAERGGATELFQCKNLDHAPTAEELTEYLEKFRREWLGKAGLPAPRRFVLCIAQPFRDVKADSAWIRAEAALRERGIEADLWHRDDFDHWLKRKPDIVADLFSDRHAEAFCEIDDWHADLFAPLAEGASGDPRLRRYFEHRRTDRLYVDPAIEGEITEALEHSPVVALRGLPGTGKTFTSLAVAEAYRSGTWRTYFVDAGEELTRAALRAGVRRRLSRPSIVVVENCHEKPTVLEQALGDLAPELASGRVKVVCLFRWVSSPDRSRSDDSEFVQELETRGAAVALEVDDAFVRRIVAFWRPELAGLSEERLSKLGALSGKNLLLLDEILDAVGSAQELDTFSAAGMYDRVRRAFFGYRTADELRGVRTLAALAQFDVRPRADVVTLHDEEREAVESLCVRAGRPPRWNFLHSTAAELVVHALWSGMGVTDPGEVAREVAADIVGYLAALQQPDLRPPTDPVMMEADFLAVVHNRLLLGKAGENRLKGLVLDSEPARAACSRLEALPAYARVMSICVQVAHHAGAGSTPFYARRLAVALREMLRPDAPGEDAALLPLLGLFLRGLKIAAADEYEHLLQGVDAESLLERIADRGTVLDLFKIVEHASPELMRQLVERLDDAQVEAVVARTISAARSIGTLNLSMRQMRSNGAATEALADELERKVGPERLLRLIEANGTVAELFGVVQYGSRELAAGLVERLHDGRIASLVARTIASGRSVGSLHFTLRTLRGGDERSRSLGEELERKVGASRFLELIEANGTIYELFRIVQSASPGFARLLIERLDEAWLEALVAKTISTGRSIGTLNLTLGELRGRDAESRALGEALERKIGPARLFRLIEANGTLYELFGFIPNTSLEFARELVERMDPERVDALVSRTISTGRSIATLNLALRELRGRDAGSRLLGEQLEAKVGPERFLRLIEANGTVIDLLRILEHATPELAAALVERLDEPGTEMLVAKAISSGRSVGTLHLMLRTLLRGRDEKQAVGEEVERKLGAARLFALIEANGTVFELFRLVQYVSPAVAWGLVEQLDARRMDALVARAIAAGRSIGTLSFTLGGLRRWDAEAKALAESLERRLGVQGFWTLLVGVGSPGPLVDLVREFSPGFRDDFLRRASEATQAEWAAVLNGGNVFELCELVSTDLMSELDAVGEARLLGAVQEQAPRLVASGNWYQRNTARKRLATSPESPARSVVEQAMQDWLSGVRADELLFPTLSEAVNGLDLLYACRPDLSSALTVQVRDLLPPADSWKLDPRTDMGLPRLLLKMASAEFPDDEVEYIMGGVIESLTPRLVVRCRTLDLVWNLWALFALAVARTRLSPAQFGQVLPPALVDALGQVLARPVEARGKRDELRLRFALVGLLSLFARPADPHTVGALGQELARSAVAGGWWLTAGQGFVPAWLVLRGIETARRFPRPVRLDFLERLLSAAEDYPELDPAAEHLRRDVLRQMLSMRAA